MCLCSECSSWPFLKFIWYSSLIRFVSPKNAMAMSQKCSDVQFSKRQLTVKRETTSVIHWHHPALFRFNEMHSFLITSTNLFWASAVQAQLSTAAVLQNTWCLTHISLTHKHVHTQRQSLLCSWKCVQHLPFVKLSCCLTVNLNWYFSFLHSYPTLANSFIPHAPLWVKIMPTVFQQRQI